MDVVVYTRHGKHCPHFEQRYWRRCRCPKWLAITDKSGRTLRSAKTRSWEEAERQRAELLKKPSLSPRIEFAVKRYIERCRQIGLEAASVRANEIVLDGLSEYGNLEDLTLERLEQYRSRFRGKSITRARKQERLIAFLNYCHRHGWIERVPKLDPIRVERIPTGYFDKDEMARILAAATKPLTNLFIRVSRWSGLRTGDVVALTPERVVDGRILLYMQKTGEPVFVPLPEDVVADLATIKRPYYFWLQANTLDTARKRWYDKLKRVFKKAGIGKRAHPQMLRDTFAVELLLSGVPLDQVSLLLGHTRIQTTEESYAPFVKARQQQLEEAVRKSWG